MLNALGSETLLTLREAAKRFPGHRKGTRLHPATLTRYILKGSKATDGSTVKLEAIRFGVKWLTSSEAVDRFCAALRPQPTDCRPGRTPAQRNRSSERAEAELIASGM